LPTIILPARFSTLTALALLNCLALRCQRSDCKYFPACRSIGKQLVQFLRKEFPNATVAIRRGHPNEAMVMMARGTPCSKQTH